MSLVRKKKVEPGLFLGRALGGSFPGVYMSVHRYQHFQKVHKLSEKVQHENKQICSNLESLMCYSRFTPARYITCYPIFIVTYSQILLFFKMKGLCLLTLNSKTKILIMLNKRKTRPKFAFFFNFSWIIIKMLNVIKLLFFLTSKQNK